MAGDTWITKTAAPDSNDNFASCWVGTDLYIFNGSLRKTWKYDSVADSWTTRTPPPSVSNGGKAFYIGSLVWIFGQGSNSIPWTYDPATDTWVTTGFTTPATPRPLQFAGVAIGTKVYLFGGITSGPSLERNIVRSYETTTDTWATLTSMPTARYAPGASVIGGLVYVAGGRTAASNAGLATLEVYDPAGNSWTSVTPMTVARYEPLVQAAGGKLYVIGGTASGSRKLTNEQYTPATDTWATKANMTTAKGQAFAASTSLADRYIYAAMGGGGSGGTNTNYMYDAGPPRPTPLRLRQRRDDLTGSPRLPSFRYGQRRSIRLGPGSHD